MLEKKLGVKLYCQCNAEFALSSLFNKIIMLTVTWIITLRTFLSSFIEIVSNSEIVLVVIVPGISKKCIQFQNYILDL